MSTSSDIERRIHCTEKMGENGKDTEPDNLLERNNDQDEKVEEDNNRPSKLKKFTGLLAVFGEVLMVVASAVSVQLLGT